jgi:hypothetical protein
LFFALSNAILIIPPCLVPSWLALASTGCDVCLLVIAVALWDTFDEGQALRFHMLRSFAGSIVVAVLSGTQALISHRGDPAEATAQLALTVLLFTSLAIAIAAQVLANPWAGMLDRMAFWQSPTLRTDRPRCGAPRPHCRCPRLTRWTTSATTRSPGSPGASSPITATCPSWWPAPLTALRVIDEAVGLPWRARSAVEAGQ